MDKSHGLQIDATLFLFLNFLSVSIIWPWPAMTSSAAFIIPTNCLYLRCCEATSHIVPSTHKNMSPFWWAKKGDFFTLFPLYGTNVSFSDFFFLDGIPKGISNIPGVPETKVLLFSGTTNNTNKSNIAFSRDLNGLEKVRDSNRHNKVEMTLDD